MRGPGRRPHPKKKAFFDLPACLRRRRGASERSASSRQVASLARRPAGGLVSRRSQQVCCQKNKLGTSLQQSSRVGQRGAAQARHARAPRERKETHQLASARRRSPALRAHAYRPVGPLPHQHSTNIICSTSVGTTYLTALTTAWAALRERSLSERLTGARLPSCLSS